MKNYIEFLAESLKDYLNQNFKSAINRNSNNLFNSDITRFEYHAQIEYGKGFKSLNYLYNLSGTIDNVELFRKKILNPNASTYSSIDAFTTLNYNKLPILTIIYNSRNYRGDISSQTGLIDANKFAIFAILGFNSNLDKAIEFFNKRFLSALGLEINKNNQIFNDTENLIKTSNVENLILKENVKSFYDIITKYTEFKDFNELEYVQKRQPNLKSDKDRQIIDKTQFYIGAITKYLEHEFKDNKEYFNFGIHKFPKNLILLD